MVKKCPNCGKEFSDENKFCNKCGSDLVEKSANKFSKKEETNAKLSESKINNNFITNIGEKAKNRGINKKHLYICALIVICIIVVALILTFTVEPDVTLTDISASKYDGVTYGWDGSVDKSVCCDINFTAAECSLEPTDDDYVTVRARFYDGNGKELSDQPSIFMDKVNGTSSILKLEEGGFYSFTVSNISNKTSKIVLEVVHDDKVISNYSADVKKITKEDPYEYEFEDIQKYDTNGDNLLDYDEYRQSWEDARSDVASWDSELFYSTDWPSYDECFNSVDSNKDGKISVRELYGM